MSSNNGFTTEQELERYKRWLEDRNKQVKELSSKVEQYEEMIFERLKPNIGEDEMLTPFIQGCESIRGY